MGAAPSLSRDPLSALRVVPSAVWWVASVLGAFYILGRWPQIGAHVGTGFALVLRGISNGVAELFRISASGAAGVVREAASGVGDVGAGVVSVGVSAMDAVRLDDALSVATGGIVWSQEAIRAARYSSPDEVARDGLVVARSQAISLGDWGSYWAILRGDVDRAVRVLRRTGQYSEG